MVVALVTIALLIANLYPGIREDLLKERVLTLVGIVVGLTVIIALLALGGASLGWTGFGDKKLWDWLELLLVPLILGALAFGLTWWQSNSQQAIDARNETKQQAIQAQNETLQ
jgi:hypothetical protein